MFPFHRTASVAVGLEKPLIA